jgi:hypothetical protein
MTEIKKYDILICVNEKDPHFLKNCKVESVECDTYSPNIKYVSVRYNDSVETYKALDMEYNFIIVKGQPLIFD